MRRPPVCKWLACAVLALVAIGAIGCGDPTYTSLQVEPTMITLHRGESMSVTASYVTNMVPRAVGSEATWQSLLPSIAAVSAGSDGHAQITGVGNGATQVVVTASTLHATVRVEVIDPDITGLTIEPPSVTLPAGLQTQLTAQARLVDGSTHAVTGQVTWESAQPEVATIDAAGEVTTHATGTAVITATLEDQMAIATVTVTAAKLTAIAVTPDSPQVPIGATRSLTATGTFTDGSMRDVTAMVQWSAQFPAVASVSLVGVVTGNQLGSTKVTAQMGNVLGSTTVMVVPPVLVSIAVTPANPTIAVGQAQAFLATGTYSDASTANLTAMVTWSSSMMNVATISNAAGTQGRASALAMGTTSIKATLGAIEGMTNLTVGAPVLTSISVTPPGPQVPLGRTQQFMATGTYSDGSMANLTTMVTWSSTMMNVASISNAAGSQGRATALAVGATSIHATSGQVTGMANLIVGAPAVDMITVTPASTSLPIGATRQMHAMGAMSDGSMQDLTATVTWSSSMPARATITAAGVARGVAIGPTTITAQSGTVMGSTTLTITMVELASIAVTPANPTIVAGGTQQFTATGTYTDASTADLTMAATWDSTATGVATISNQAGSKGLATTHAGGTSTISATVGAISGSTMLTSQAATVSAFSPADGASSIRAATPVSFTFSQPMDPNSLFGQLMDGPCAGNLQLSQDDFASCLAFTAGAPAMSAGNTVATLQPAAPLRALGRYKLRATSTATAATGITLQNDVTQATAFTIATDGECAADVVISQVYGGGSNAGAPLRSDFVELHNPGPTAVALGGKALQLASAGGGAWTVQALPSVSIPAGGYYLVQESGSNGAFPALPAPDFTPASTFDLNATAAKVALTATTTPLAGACPLTATLDLVGYGGAASCFEGAAPVGAPDNTTAVLRAGGGCTDRNVETDFTVGAPAPRTGATAPSVCVCYVNETDLEAEVDYCNLQFPTVVNNQPAPFMIPAVYGRVYEAGVTEAPGASPLVRMAIGFGPADSPPASWPWTPASFNVSVGNDDEYQAPITFATPGEYDFTSRATRDGTNWTLCDIDGAGSNFGLRFDQFQTGSATIQ
ncbi:MAG TPA: Ig-like domain-containing protein [Kofleriaceae bacterium]|nr:Ig-like domain-containing protein [Kofleriaceae bacterium]